MQGSKDDLNAFERAQVQFKEIEKHLTSKVKKINKIVSDVSHALLQEKRKLSEDETWIANFDADVSKAEGQRDEISQRLEKEQEKLSGMLLELQGNTS